MGQPKLEKYINTHKHKQAKTQYVDFEGEREMYEYERKKKKKKVREGKSDFAVNLKMKSTKRE